MISSLIHRIEWLEKKLVELMEKNRKLALRVKHLEETIASRPT